MHTGSCLCGAIQYEIDCEPKFASVCHCTMCKKQHGSAFAPYITFPKKYLTYTKGEVALKAYNSSSTIQRKFCSDCGSSIEWSGHPDYPTMVSISLGTLDTEYMPEQLPHYHSETKATWMNAPGTTETNHP